MKASNRNAIFLNSNDMLIALVNRIIINIDVVVN